MSSVAHVKRSLKREAQWLGTHGHVAMQYIKAHPEDVNFALAFKARILAYEKMLDTMEAYTKWVEEQSTIMRRKFTLPILLWSGCALACASFGSWLVASAAAGCATVAVAFWITCEVWIRRI